MAAGGEAEVHPLAQVSAGIDYYSLCCRLQALAQDFVFLLG
jgi:hypothetical protein